MITSEIRKINGEIEAGNYEAAIKLIETLPGKSNDEKLLKSLFLADNYIFQGEFNKADQLYKKAKSDVIKTESPYLKLYFANIFSGLYLRQGDLDNSRIILTQYYDLANELNMKRSDSERIYTVWTARYFHSVGNLFLKMGKLEEAKENFGKSISLKQHIDDLKGIASSLNRLSIISKYQGRLLESIELSEESIQIDDDLGNVQAMATTLMTMAIARRELKQEKEALECLERSSFYLQKEQNPYLLARVNHELFITLVEKNRDLAVRFFEEIKEIYNEHGNHDGIKIIFDLTNAVYLKTSNRGKDKYQSQELLIEIITRPLIDYKITVYAILNLIELHLEEFQSYGQEEVFLEIVDRIEQLKLMGITHNLLLLIGEVNLLEGKFELLKGNITEANDKYESALSYARFNGLENLVEKILTEKSSFEADLQKWESLSHKGAKLLNELSKNELENYIEQIANLRDIA